MFASKKVGRRRRVSVIATISTYLQRETCFTDWRDTIVSASWRKEAGSRIQEQGGGGGGGGLERAHLAASAWNSSRIEVNLEPNLLDFHHRSQFRQRSHFNQH